MKTMLDSWLSLFYVYYHHNGVFGNALYEIFFSKLYYQNILEVLLSCTRRTTRYYGNKTLVKTPKIDVKKQVFISLVAFNDSGN